MSHFTRVTVFSFMALLTIHGSAAHAANPFASRKAPSVPAPQPVPSLDLSEEISATETEVSPALEPAPRAAAPVRVQSIENPPESGDDWLRVPFEQAENEVLMYLKRDLPKIEEKTPEVALYEVKVSGRLPVSYGPRFRNKLERVLISSRSLKLKECPSCEQARLYRTEAGDLKYETYTADPKRAAQVAAELGVTHVLMAELAYSPEDLQLRMRLVEASTGRVEWIKEYATADIVKTREALVESEYSETGQGDSLARLMIGEIAFSTVLSTGVAGLPSVNGGTGSGMVLMPNVDFLIGEEYDRGKKRFGFNVGAAFNMGSGDEKKKPLPFLIHVGPQFRYTFNPYNVTTARFSLVGELGGMFSSGMTTAFAAFGPEMMMIKRFSVSLMPMYILPASVNGSQVLKQNDEGTIESLPGKKEGTFGGFGFIAKVNINF